MMRRHVECKSHEIITQMYNSYVRPILEHCAEFWCPHTVQDIDMLETVQEWATKMIPGFRLHSYQDRLATLNMFSLRRWRLRGDMIEVYKMLNRLDRVEFDRLFVRDMSNTRGHSCKLFKNMFHTQIRQKFFTQR